MDPAYPYGLPGVGGMPGNPFLPMLSPPLWHEVMQLQQAATSNDVNATAIFEALEKIVAAIPPTNALARRELRVMFRVGACVTDAVTNPKVVQTLLNDNDQRVTIAFMQTLPTQLINCTSGITPEELALIAASPEKLGAVKDGDWNENAARSCVVKALIQYFSVEPIKVPIHVLIDLLEIDDRNERGCLAPDVRAKIIDELDRRLHEMR